MRITRIFQNGDFSLGSTITLDPDIFQHVIKVLRLKLGDPLVIFNGTGRAFSTTITVLEKKTCQVFLESEQIFDAPKFDLTLAQAIIKPDKMDLVIQKAVELGVTHIVPLISDYCDIKLKQNLLQKRQDHWQKIIISACEQCGVNFLPKLSPIQAFNDWINSRSNEQKIILNPNADKTFSDLPNHLKQLSMAIGPEGGWSNAEVTLAKECDFMLIALGNRILRAETAAIASLAICQYRWNY